MGYDDMRVDEDGQMEFDTRLDSERDLEENVAAAEEFACRQLEAMHLPHVTSRHDGYGIASEYYQVMKNTTKGVDQSMKEFLTILPSDNSKGIEAAASLKNAASKLVLAAITLTAQADRIMNDLYRVVGEEKTPIEEYMEANAEDFEEALEEEKETEPAEDTAENEEEE